MPVMLPPPALARMRWLIIVLAVYVELTTSFLAVVHPTGVTDDTEEPVRLQAKSISTAQSPAIASLGIDMEDAVDVDDATKDIDIPEPAPPLKAGFVFKPGIMQ